MTDDVGSHRGQATSWLTVGVIVVGFLISGIAMLLGPSWPMFWGGGVVIVLGGLLGLSVGILADTVMDGPRVLPPELGGRPRADDVERDRQQLPG